MITNQVKNLMILLFVGAITIALNGMEDSSYPKYIRIFLATADRDNPQLANIVRDFLAKNKIGKSKLKKIDQGTLRELLEAIDDNNENMVERILQEGFDLNYDGGTILNIQNPLTRAVFKDNVKIAKMLISHGADVNLPLRLLNNHSALGAVDSVEMLNLFLKNGANIQAARGDEGQEFLIGLIIHGNIPMVDKLLEYKDINGQYNFGRGDEGTPLMAAVKNGNYNMVEHLLIKGARPNIYVKGYAHQREHTALQIAEEKGGKDIIDLLIKHGAKQ